MSQVTEMRCKHGFFIRKDGKRLKPPVCGCKEIDICLGCGKENCDGCPCGTGMTVREADEDPNLLLERPF